MATAINRSGRIPLYYQIHEMPLRDIESGRLRPGDRVVSLAAAAACLLKKAAESPVFEAKRWGYLPDGRLIEYVESLLRSDRYTLQIELGESC